MDELHLLFQITRTVKFLSAVSICKFLVAPGWVDDSFEAKTFLGEYNITFSKILYNVK